MGRDLGEWSATATGSQPRWEARARVIGKLVRGSDWVLDLGAGNRKLAAHLPATASYTPVDIVDDLPGTFVVDFNREFRLPDVPFTVVVCAGILEYIDDLPGFFRNLACHAPGRHIIFTYLVDPKKTERAAMRVHNNYASADDLLAAIGGSLANVDFLCRVRKSLYFTATLSPEGDRNPPRRILLNEILALRQSEADVGSPARRLSRRLFGQRTRGED